LPTAVLIAVYFVLGYLFYACAFAVTGAVVSRQEDVQSSSGPLTLVLIVAYLVAISAADSPESTLAVAATLIPPLAPMIVPARAAQDALPLGELALSLVLMALATALLLWIADRVYDRTVLRMGAPMKLRDALRLARRS
jgi:ABC-2 type transport system permease protein